MTRETKFRAWDTLEQRMIYDGCFDSFDSGYEGGCKVLRLCFDGSIVGYMDDDGGKNGLHEHEVNIPPGRFILQRFTGLHDKNGVPIYEGDIVKEYYRGDILEVAWGGVWRYAAFGLQRKSATHERGYTWDSLTPECASDIEIIGNVYEQPELLCESKPEVTP